MPEAVLVSLSIRLTITRSPKGRSFMESPGLETRVEKQKHLLPVKGVLLKSEEWVLLALISIEC
jgi:hypothetical protein